ncbi:TPA: polyhydroxyalkanoate depolymerase, partial [bacterium]|nr:polyhydroxyalkanoate depolymerase [bacterium]
MEDWEKKAAEILSSGRIIIVIGAVDTGKTTLVTYLANKAAEGGKVVGIVDADIGQSDIGPPTTIGLGMIKEPVEDLRKITPADLYFVGSLSPKGHLLPMVVGTRRMVEHAFQLGAQKVIIDTTGLISQ